MGDHDDGLAEFPHGVTHERQDFAARGAVEVAGGLIGEDDLGLAGQCSGHGNSLLLTTREFTRAMAEAFAQTHGVNHVLQPRFVRLGSSEVHREGDVLPCGQRWNEVEGLEDESEPVPAEQCEFTLAGHGQVCVTNERRARIEAIESGMQCIKVDLPEPEGPMMAVKWPAMKSTSTLSSATTSVSPVP